MKSSHLAREFFCELQGGPCTDANCVPGDCIPAKNMERAFRRRMLSHNESPEEAAWFRAFIAERREVVRFFCRQNKIQYTQAIGDKYINDPRVVCEALRRLRKKSKL